MYKSRLQRSLLLSKVRSHVRFLGDRMAELAALLQVLIGHLIIIVLPHIEDDGRSLPVGRGGARGGCFRCLRSGIFLFELLPLGRVCTAAKLPLDLSRLELEHPALPITDDRTPIFDDARNRFGE